MPDELLLLLESVEKEQKANPPALAPTTPTYANFTTKSLDVY